MIAYDSVYPANVATGTVNIRVLRNPSTPEFQDEKYEKTIDEKMALGDSVITIIATDADKDDVEYEMQGDGESQQFFYLNPLTGVVTTKKFLTETKTKEFKVMSHVYKQSDSLLLQV